MDEQQDAPLAAIDRDGVVLGPDGLPRCAWVGDDPLYREYHDREWGHPLVDDRDVFERITLEGFQAGLSWITILRKRDAFRAAFADFDPVAVAAFDDDDVARLMADAGIVRNRAKIDATIGNARATLELIGDDPGTLLRLVTSYAPTDPRPRPRALAEVPAQTAESVALSRDLKKRGFRFVGPTTMYALMQATGIVDDHVEGCLAASAP